MYAIYRVRQTTTKEIIVHRRHGNRRIRSKYDIMYNSPGKWGTLCSAYTTGNVNVTTNDNEVTCMRCLKRMES